MKLMQYWHHVTITRTVGIRLAITFCPLCNLSILMLERPWRRLLQQSICPITTAWTKIGVNSYVIYFRILQMLCRWWYAALHILVMWVSSFKCESSQTPRFFAVLTLPSWGRVPITMNSVLSSFSFSLSVNIHILMSLIHLSIVFVASCSIKELSGLYDRYSICMHWWQMTFDHFK